MKNYLWLPGWKTDEPILEGETATIPAEYTVLPDHCPHCGVIEGLHRASTVPQAGADMRKLLCPIPP